MNNRTAYLVSKKLTGEISESEIQELNLQLMQDPDLYEKISRLEILWQHNSIGSEAESDISNLLRKLNSADPDYFKPDNLIELPASQRKRFTLTTIRALQAAAAVVVLLIGLWIFRSGSETEKPARAREIPLSEVTTKAGNRTQIVLRDGTKVWLNGDSKLSYKQIADSKLREVYLSGEAYFEVVSNPSRPFIIHTEKTIVKVTGTTLNVRDYPGEEKAETSLLTGKAEVMATNNPSGVVVLKPNEKVVFRRYEEVVKTVEAKAIKPSQVVVSYKPDVLKLIYYPNDTIPVATAWVADQLVFIDEPFGEVAQKMEKWYNVSIEIRSPELASIHLNGKFEKESLQVALEALQFSTPFKYTIEGNKIIIENN